MPAPKISVVMPFYNCEKYLDDSISSILSQTFRDIEYIIIDDASTDASEEIVRKYMEKDTRIQYIRNPENKGKAYSCNLGIDRASGVYIAIMDGDDVSLPTRLEEEFLFLESHSDIDVVGTQQILIDSDGKEFGELHKPVSSEEISKAKILFQPMNHPTMLIRADVLRRFRYREKYGEFEDNDLYMRLFLAGIRGYNLPKSLCLYRIHENNVNNKGSRMGALKFYKCQMENIKMYHYTPSLKEYVFIYGYLITGSLLTPTQQRTLQRWIKTLLYKNL